MSPSTNLLHVRGRPPSLLRLTGIVDVLDGGNHHPLLCKLEDAAGSVRSWVVKPQDVLSTGNRRDGAINLLAELAGAEVCAWAGVRTPAIGLVRFPEEPENALSGSLPEFWRSEVATVLKMNRGRLGFCCRFLEDTVDVDPDSLDDEQLSADLLQSRAALFFVDVYIRHDDRRRQNPNAVWLDDEIVALDHGASFVNLDQLGATGADVAARTVIHKSFHEHVLHDYLAKRRDRLDLPFLARRLADVADATIDGLATSWPDELEPHRGRFIEFLKHRRTHALGLAEDIVTFLGAS